MNNNTNNEGVRTTVMINEDTHIKLKEFKELTGIKPSDIINMLLETYMEEKAKYMIELKEVHEKLCQK